MHRRLVITVAAAALLFAACGGSGAKTTPSAPEDRGSYEWADSEIRTIAFKGKSATPSPGVKIDGSTVTIREPGTYRLSGKAEARLVVDLSGREGTVGLILAGVELTSSSGPALEVDDATEVHIVLAASSQNRLADSKEYTFPDPATNEPNAAVFSKRDLTISGTGALTVIASYRDGIASKDNLRIAGGTITVEAPDDGLRGRDSLTISGGSVTVRTRGDGLRTSNETAPATLGGVIISGGTLSVVSLGDAIDAAGAVRISGGNVTLTTGGGTTGGGAAAGPQPERSIRGVKAGDTLQVENAAVTIDAADDGLNARSVRILSGQISIATGDDAIHAEESITIEAGTVTIPRSVEGLEATDITIKGGTISITAENDGLNNPFPSVSGSTAQASSGTITINGGSLVVTSEGDGIDAGVNLSVTGGVVVVHGPATTDNAPVDFSSGFDYSGGVVLLFGRELKPRAPSSGKPGVLLTLDAPTPAGTVIHIAPEGAFKGMTVRSAKVFQTLMLAAPGMTLGQSLSIVTGGEVSGTEFGGLYTDGKYTGGKVRGTASPILQAIPASSP